MGKKKGKKTSSESQATDSDASSSQKGQPPTAVVGPSGERPPSQQQQRQEGPRAQQQQQPTQQQGAWGRSGGQQQQQQQQPGGRGGPQEQRPQQQQQQHQQQPAQQQGGRGGRRGQQQQRPQQQQQQPGAWGGQQQQQQQPQHQRPQQQQQQQPGAWGGQQQQRPQQQEQQYQQQQSGGQRPQQQQPPQHQRPQQQQPQQQHPGEGVGHQQQPGGRGQRQQQQAPLGFGRGRGKQQQQQRSFASPPTPGTPVGSTPTLQHSPSTQSISSSQTSSTLDLTTLSEPLTEIAESTVVRRSPPQHPFTSPLKKSPLANLKGNSLTNNRSYKPGSKGKSIIIEVNHLRLDLGKLKVAYHYDVAFKPDTPKSLFRQAIAQFQRQYYPNYFAAFDGRKNVYSARALPFPNDQIGGTVTVPGDNKDREFKIEMKLVRTVDLTPLQNVMRQYTLTPQDALQCVDIVLRNAPTLSCITSGRSFFTCPTENIYLEEGMQMYHGFYQSAIRGWKIYLNVDVSHKAFPIAQPVINLMLELGARQDELNRNVHPQVIDKVEKYLKGLKVKYQIPNQPSSKRVYRVNGLDTPARQAKFTCNDKETTVEAYFQNVKRVRLNYPLLPTVWVGSRDRENKMLLPMEFCTIEPGQVVQRKMTEKQTSNMIRYAATSTSVRKQKIMNSLRQANFNDDPCVREFGFSVNSEFERLQARILQPPTIRYAQNRTVDVFKGVWRNDRLKFYNGATIQRWTIVCFAYDRFLNASKIEELADMIFRTATQYGIVMENRAIPPFENPRINTIRDVINYFNTKKDFDLIFVILPNAGPQYAFAKKASELHTGCLTQCIKCKTVTTRCNPQTVLNILLKVNSKMNGTNHVWHTRPSIMNRPCMVMGADVTHPSPDAKSIPSVAAVTASFDPNAFLYNICWRLQPPKIEIISDLENITKEQLMFFYKKNKGLKPEKIVFLRDGVSEGQFQQVQETEIAAIQRACRSLQKEAYEPAIVFLVVQKRHHTRFFPTNERDSDDKNFNVRAGTCVDTEIVNPMLQDFYLVSHASIQGVAKPTKYVTLWDDVGLSNDDVQEFVYFLCHMFTRCNRSVSYPAPTYYAHLAAARGKVYIENERPNMDNLQREQEKFKILDQIVKEKPMFFV